MVQEAGGMVTDLQGNPVNVNNDRIHIIVSNGLIHQKLLDIWRRVDKEHSK
jgi:fructose-1,6-bisphosphatase/inositol monophosphatase family enzyme